MILRKLRITYLGPFAKSTEFSFEPDLTVFTGANDAGKSSILAAIKILYRHNDGRSIDSELVNIDRFHREKGNWTQDRQVCLWAEFSTSGQYDLIQIDYTLPPNVRDIQAKTHKVGAAGWTQNSPPFMPTVLELPLDEPIRTTIDLTAPNATELAFLNAAFGAFSHEKFAGIPPHQFHTSVKRAERIANERLRGILPPTLTFQFEFVVHNDRKSLIVNVVDHVSGHTALHLRGSGLRQLVNLMGGLISGNDTFNKTMLIMDEPERSLHADAQRALRSVLEKLGESGNCQVVYCTHSPAMINPMRARSVRLVRRTTFGEIANSEVDEKPNAENFASVRSSLGVSPTDSLIIGPVSVVVEGASEVLAIPILLEKLQCAGVTGFEDVSSVFGRVQFVDGSGDRFVDLCKVIASHQTFPIVFLDGDKTGSRLVKLQKDCPTVPIVMCDDGEEFEDLVERAAYFRGLVAAMSEFDESASDKLTPENYEAWNEKSLERLPPKKMFSKRVDDWVDETLGLDVPKPLVMKTVAMLADAKEIRPAALLRLVAATRKAVENA